MGVVLTIVRRWAAFRGERCLTTMDNASPPYGRGEELIVGNRCYVVTRVLRAGRLPRSAEYRWEIWARRQPGAGHHAG